MIIKGGAAGNVGWWGRHLMRDDTNERADLVEVRGLLAEDTPAALREMQAIAAQSRSGGNFMYQANINPRADEHLTAEQWKVAIDTLEKNLGFEGHQRIVVEHEKDGRQHRHVVWNRVDVETLRVVDIGGNYYTHERTARDLEAQFGLSPTPSLHGTSRPDGRPPRAETLADIRAEERSGIPRDALKAEITELWRTTDSGQAFAAALHERGYILAQGDRRDFCIVDAAGTAHSLARRIDGVRAKDVRERMADVDRASLPTVAQARETQRTRTPPAFSRQVAPAPRSNLRPSASISRPQPGRSTTATAGRAAGGMVGVAGKALGGIASAFEGLFGGGSTPRPKDSGPDPKEAPPPPVDRGQSHQEPPPGQVQAEADQTARRHQYLREHSREVPDEIQHTTDLGRERRRGE